MKGFTVLAAWIGVCSICLVGSAGGLPISQLPPVPGYIPVYIQNGDSPPDVQRLYEAQRPPAVAFAPPSSTLTRRHTPEGSGPRVRPAGLAGPAQLQAAGPAGAASTPAEAPRAPPPPQAAPPPPSRSPASRPGAPSRITKKGVPVPAAPGPSNAPGAAVAVKAQSNAKTATALSTAKKRTGTRVQYQQQQKAAQTRKRQQQQRQQQQPQPHHPQR